MATPIRRAAAAEVREAIRDARLTQKHVAALAGIPSTPWKRRMNGACEFTLSQLVRIAHQVDVPLPELVAAIQQRADEEEAAA